MVRLLSARPATLVLLLTSHNLAAAEETQGSELGNDMGYPKIFNLNKTRVYKSTDLIHGISGERWEAAFEQPDARGIVNITGYDITAPYPGSKSEDWQYTIQVKSGIPVDEEKGGGSITGVWVQMHVPDSLLKPKPDNECFRHVPQDMNTWEVCRVVYVMSLPAPVSDTPISGPGCQGALSEQCISDWKKMLVKEFETEDEYIGYFQKSAYSTCPISEVRNIPPSCLEAGESYLEMGLWGGSTFNDPRNAPDRFLSEETWIDTNYRSATGKFSFLRFTTHAATDPSNREKIAAQLEEASQRVLVIAHIWGSPGQIWRNTTSPDRTAEIELTCLQANQDGSKGEDDTGGNNAEFDECQNERKERLAREKAQDESEGYSLRATALFMVLSAFTALLALR